MDGASSTVAVPLSHSEVRSIIIGIMLAMFLAALDQTIVATAMPTIGAALGDAEHLPWIVTAYLLAGTAVTPLYGKISDIHGRRVTILAGITIFVVGSIACALAPNLATLIVARGVQGLGGGGLISLAQTIIADVTTPKERSRFQGYIAGVFVVSSFAGPVLGGVFAEHLHWSMIFWINVPLGIAAYLMTDRLLRKLPRHDRKHSLDFAGAFLMVVATVMALLALSWGGLRYPWASTEIVGLLAGSAVFWVLFYVRLRHAAEPFVPLSVLSNQVVFTGTLSASFCMGTFIGLTIYTPIYLQAVYGLSVASSGLALIPLMVGTAIGATFSGRMMSGLKHYKRMPFVGLSVAVCALAVMAVVPRGVPLFWLEVLFTAISMGIGSLLPITTICVQNAVPLHQLGTTTGTMNFFRSLFSAMIVAAFGAIVLGSLPAGAGGDVGEGLGANLLASGVDFAPVFRWVFAAAALGLVLSLTWLTFMEERPMRTRHTPEAAFIVE